MKKVLLLASVAVLVLSSCKKERTCTCTKDGKETVTVYKDYKKSVAKSACEGKIKTTKVSGVDQSEAKFSDSSCELK